MENSATIIVLRKVPKFCGLFHEKAWLDMRNDYRGVMCLLSNTGPSSSKTPTKQQDFFITRPDKEANSYFESLKIQVFLFGFDYFWKHT